jgi:hypothetical protein
LPSHGEIGIHVVRRDRMNHGTKYVVALTALGLALSGCGAGADASPGGEANDEVASVSEALTTERGTAWITSPLYLHWDGVTVFLDNYDDHTDPVTAGYSAYVQIYNANPRRVHMRRIQIDLFCAQQAWGKGAIAETEFVFSSYVDGNGGMFERSVICPYGFGYPYIVKSQIYTESSFGD